MPMRRHLPPSGRRRRGGHQAAGMPGERRGHVKDARLAAKAVTNSALLKAAMFGADANWGRVLCAIGYSGAAVDVHAVDVAFASAAGSIDVCQNGAGIPVARTRPRASSARRKSSSISDCTTGTRRRWPSAAI